MVITLSDRLTTDGDVHALPVYPKAQGPWPVYPKWAMRLRSGLRAFTKSHTNKYGGIFPVPTRHLLKI